MQSKERYVVAGVVALAILLGLTLSNAFQWIFVQAGWNDPYLFGMRQLPLTAAVSYGLAAAAAIVVLKYPVSAAFANEVVDELTKVTWPGREEVGQATMVVIVAIVISAAFLGVLDAFWLWATSAVLGAGGAS